MSKPFSFISGWGFESQIGKHLFSETSTHFINLPGVEKDSVFLEGVCSVLKEKLEHSCKILVGWSLGGLFALKLAERSLKPKALILISSTPCFGARGQWPGISKKDQDIFINKLEGSYSDFLAYFLKLVTHPFSLSKAFNLKPYIISENLFENYKAYQKILFEGDLREHYAHLKIPTLVIYGDRDSIIPYPVMACLKKLNNRPEYHTIQGAGHLLFSTHASEIKKIITDFLQKIQ